MYSAQPYQFSRTQILDLRALASTVDVKPGPGGSRIVPVVWNDHRSQFWGPLNEIIPHYAMDEYPVRVVALFPSSQLVAHCDPAIQGTRFHMPLVTNSGCWSFSGGVWQQLDVGKVYQMDPTEIHGAVNWGTEVRLHLIVDVA